MGDLAVQGVSTTVDEDLLHYLSLMDIANLIKTKKISPVKITEYMLERIARLDCRLKSYATVMAEQALAAAYWAEQEIIAGKYRGVLHGVPIAVKDLCFTKDIRTMGGLGVLTDFMPDHDATVVASLKAAGAIILGKLNLTEGAMAGYHPDFSIPVNPWGKELWAGASSSGSGVATAAGLCFASVGSDTGGSIRFPSLANGIVGLKPTYGRVSRYGVLALADSLDHVGPMVRTSADAAVVFEAMAGFDDNDSTSLRAPVPDMIKELGKGIKGVKIGFDRGYATENVDAALVVSMDSALSMLKQQGAEICEVEFPVVSEEVKQAWFTLCSREACFSHHKNYPSRADEYGAYFREFLAMGSAVSDAEYASANQVRHAFSRKFLEAFSEVDALASPAGGVPFRVDQQNQYGGFKDFETIFAAIQVQFTFPADFAGTPALSLPCGFSDAGLPLTMQFMGKHLSEALLCRLGHAYEALTKWHENHPPV